MTNAPAVEVGRGWRTASCPGAKSGWTAVARRQCPSLRSRRGGRPWNAAAQRGSRWRRLQGSLASDARVLHAGNPARPRQRQGEALLHPGGHQAVEEGARQLRRLPLLLRGDATEPRPRRWPRRWWRRRGRCWGRCGTRRRAGTRCHRPSLCPSGDWEQCSTAARGPGRGPCTRRHGDFPGRSCRASSGGQVGRERPGAGGPRKRRGRLVTRPPLSLKAPRQNPSVARGGEVLPEIRFRRGRD